jgi:hypothetical protein
MVLADWAYEAIQADWVDEVVKAWVLLSWKARMVQAVQAIQAWLSLERFELEAMVEADWADKGR